MKLWRLIPIGLLVIAFGMAQDYDDVPDGAGGEVKSELVPPADGTPPGLGIRAPFGPDAYGYAGEDAVPYQMVDISATGTIIVQGDDSGAPAAMPMPFMFYGTNYSTLAFCTNGYLSTDSADSGGDLSNDCPLPSSPSSGSGGRIYPLHDDLITNTPGACMYEYFATCPRAADQLGGDADGCSVFMWYQTRHYGGSVYWDMEVILYHASGEILVQVAPGNTETGSGSTTGIQDPSATIGLTYACNTAGTIPDGTALAIFNPDYSAVTIPTLGTVGLIVFLVAFVAAGLFIMQRRRKAMA